MSSSAPTDPARPRGAFTAGDVLAKRYELQRRLGSGANGEVWRALDLKLDLKVAVKIPKAEALKAHDIERFRREAQALCVIHSEHVLRFLGYDDAPTSFLVMELLKGEDLAERLERGPLLSLGEVRDICTQVCEGLQAAHDAGVIHRDIKPQNIYCHDGTWKVIDFGLMKVVEPTREPPTPQMADQHTELTAKGMILGTPAYMSPEQWSGTGDNVGRGSDLWSLAVTLYKLLTGKLPFRADSRPDLWRLIALTSPPSPSSIRPELPPEFDLFFERALAKDPARRFGSATDLAREFAALPDLLTEVRAEESDRTQRLPAPTPASETATARHAQQGPPARDSSSGPGAKTRPRKAPALAGAVVVVALVAAVWSMTRPDPPRRCDVPCTNGHGTTECVVGRCSPTCDPGFGDCDGDPSNGCESDLTSPEHCGACGNRCSNAHGQTTCDAASLHCHPICAAGFSNCDGNDVNGCEADLTAPERCGMCGAECRTLVSGSAGALDLAVDGEPDGYVYWTNPIAHTVQVVAKRGGAPETVSTGGSPRNIALTGSTVYWTEQASGRVWRLDRSTKASKPVGPRNLAGREITGFALSGETLYFTMRNTGSGHMEVWRNKTQAPMFDAPVPAQDPFSIVVGSRTPVWIAESTGGAPSLWMARTGSPHEALRTSARISGLTAEPHGNRIYWMEMDAAKEVLLMSFSEDDASSKPLPLHGGAEHFARRMVVDGAWAYWTGEDGTIMKVHLESGRPIMLAAAQGRPEGIAVDREYVYWVNQGGQVMKTAKTTPQDKP